MKGRFTIAILVVSLFVFSGLMAQDFTRIFEIPFPEADVNTGGVGNILTDVDFDGDGNVDLFLASHNWNDAPNEMTPYLYKMEYNGTTWEVVWKATLDFIEKSNTWPAMAAADLDKDGKMEIIFGPVNWTTDTQPNPPRVVVFEEVGDDSDVLGVADGENYAPNAMWTITTENDQNIRPIRWVVNDIDDDGTDEVIFADRKGNNGGYHFGAFSVDNIPDNGDGSETWTMEVSALDFADDTADNKWDVAIIGNNFYTFDETEISKVSWDGSSWSYSALDPLPGGISFITAQVADINGDGTDEIVVGEGPYGGTSRSLWLLQEDGDGLSMTELADLSATIGGGYIMGGAHGDIDQDGMMDFVFGSRDANPNAAIFRLEYQGGAIDDANNYELTIIDSEYKEGGRWSDIAVANIDDDPYLEVFYASCVPAGGLFDSGTQPIVVLDYIGGGEPLEFNNLVVAPEVLLNGETPSGLRFKPGRILDDETIWFCAYDNDMKQSYVFRSVDGGATFTHNATPIEGRASQMDAFDANTALVATANGKIYKTDDGGATWTEKYSYMINVIATGWFDGCRVLSDDVAVAHGDFEPNGNMHFVRTEDKGETWTEITGIDFMNAAYGYFTWGLAACNIGETIWCTGATMETDTGYVFRSQDAGVTWESFKVDADLVNAYIRSIAFTDENNGMLTDSDGSVFKSTDGGATWTRIDNPDTSSSYVNGVVAIPNTNIIVAMDDIGVYYTNDMGATWGEMNTPPETDSDYFIGGVFSGKDFGYFFTYNGQVLRFDEQIVGVSNQIADNVPSVFHLQQNYPNPFNPVTNIIYNLPAQDHVTLKVYNLMGREVKTLVDGVVNSGTHIVQWDGRDNVGMKVTSGMYLYTLKFNNQLMTRTMTLLK